MAGFLDWLLLPTALLLLPRSCVAQQQLHYLQPRSTYMNCSGSNTPNRQCHFKNLVYDRTSQVFHVYQPTVYGPDDDRYRALRRTISKEEYPFIQPGWKSWKDEPDMDRMTFRMQELAGFPQAINTCVIKTPVHIRSPVMTRSFGHLIRDNLPFLLEAPLKYGLNPDDFTWVKWPTSLKFSGVWVEQNSHVLNKYMMLLTDAPPVGWQQLLYYHCDLPMALRGFPGTRRYVLFEEAIAGLGRETGFPECSSSLFQRVREQAFRRSGIPPGAPVGQGRIRVTFIGHLADERRRLLNVTNAIADLSSRFPEVEFVEVYFTSLHLKEQLEILSKTTVLVSTVGSASFRLVFLPDNAKLVLVGAPEFEFQGTDGKIYPPIYPFKEVDDCWSNVDYIEVIRYHVVAPEEVVPAQGREDLKPEEVGPDFNRTVFEQAKMWDADIYVQASKLEGLLKGILPTRAAPQ